ncbi:hypothetical protein WA158_006468 [Blastocystis sp. Blastoise]
MVDNTVQEESMSEEELLKNAQPVNQSVEDKEQENKQQKEAVDTQKEIPEFTKPSWIILVLTLIALGGIFAICHFILDKDACGFYWQTYPRILGAVYFIWLFVLIYQRIHTYGFSGYYETFWYCNIVLFCGGLGLMFGYPHIIGMCFCLAMFPHSYYWIDTICWITIHKCPLHTATYLFDPNWPILDKITTLHHFLFMPSIFIAFYKYPPVSFWACVLAIFLFMYEQIICRYFTPCTVIDKNGNIKELNICVAHHNIPALEKVPPFSLVKDVSVFAYFSLSFVLYCVPTCTLSFGVFALAQCLLNL